jgi:hypothetical protein
MRRTTVSAAPSEVSMPDLQYLGKLLLFLGGAIFVLGLILTLGGRLPWPGRLPGDIRIEREGLSCFIPLATSLLLSLLLTVLLNLIIRFLNR